MLQATPSDPDKRITVGSSTLHNIYVCDFIKKLPIFIYILGSRDSSVRIATGYGLDGRGSIFGRRDFSLYHSVQTGSGAHPASYPMGTTDLFPWG
jgi:hypothetical protein